MLGDVEVNHPATIMAQDYKAIQYAKRSGRNRKEINSGDVTYMIVQKRPPSVRWRFTRPYHVMSNSRFCDFMAKQLEF